MSAATPDTHTSEKEHVVIALKIDLNGRAGVLLMDTGYHVASPVVVMQDELHPHTGNWKLSHLRLISLRRGLVH